MFSSEQLSLWNRELRQASPQTIVDWALKQSEGRAIVSTNFRPFEAVILHLATGAKADIPVLWVDHGYNRPATYRHAEQLRALLHLNLKSYLPRLSAAHRDALYGPLPSVGDEDGLRRFSALMKLEPFERGMAELQARVWLTALRRSQNQARESLNIVAFDEQFGVLKVSPLFYQSDQELEHYLVLHGLPNEWDYYDPAKADEKRECGLHAAWGKTATF